MNHRQVQQADKQPTGKACVLPNRAAVENRGLLWVIGAFVFCPCHLPLTLGILATLLGGTAIGSMFGPFPWIAGTIITAVWAWGTWRGLRLLRSANKYASKVVRR